MNYILKRILILPLVFSFIVIISDFILPKSIIKVEYQQVDDWNIYTDTGLIIDYSTSPLYSIRLYKTQSVIFKRTKYYKIADDIVNVEGYINNVAIPIHWMHISKIEDTRYGYIELKTK